MSIYDDVAELQTKVVTLEEQVSALQNSSNAVALTTGADIFGLAVGDYIIPNATVAETLLNKPSGSGNSTGFVSVVSGGDEGQKTVFYKTCSKNTVVHYECAYYGGAWGSWRTVHEVDSGWLDLPLESGISAHNASGFPCNYRKIGNTVYVRGCVTGFSEVEKVIATLPEGFRPSSSVYIQRSTNGGKTDTFNVRSNGIIERVATTLPTLATDNYHFIDMIFLVD